MAKQYFPNVITTMSTWHIDSHEWSGIHKTFTKKHPDWLDYIMVRLPEHKKMKDFQKHLPGNLPPVSFIEISMRKMFPWGGFGANPQHKYLKNTWEPLKNTYHGGFVYSEGIFEDLNKFTIVQLFWNPDQPVSDITKEYIAYQFTTDKTEQLWEAIDTFEDNLHYYVWDGMFGEFDHKPLKNHDNRPPKSPNAEKAYETVKRIDAELSPYAKNSFRWRVLYLRALLDYELKKNAGKPTEKCRPAFDELRKIYYVHKETFWMTRPPLMP
jgi:hypothetical protein